MALHISNSQHYNQQECCCLMMVMMSAGDMGGLGVSNIRHAMNINDVVSDTVHQFAPTYHSYVLYSNSGARNAPKTVRPKEVFVLPEEPNKFHDNANLLANMELGVHGEDGHRRTMSDQDEGSARQSAHDDALYRANTFSDVDEEFRAGPLEEDEVCLFAYFTSIACPTACLRSGMLGELAAAAADIAVVR